MSFRWPAASGPPCRRALPSLLAALATSLLLLAAPAAAQSAPSDTTHDDRAHAAAPHAVVNATAELAPESVPGGRLAITDDAAPSDSTTEREARARDDRGDAERRASGRPVSSDLTDARWAIDSLDNFRPREAVRSMKQLQRTPNAGFVLQPGYYSLDAQSYAVRIHALPPTATSAHLFAPLLGSAEEAVATIARNSVNRPEITQRDVQLLLWAIAARAKFEELPTAMKATAARLLTPRQLANLNRSGLETVPGSSLDPRLPGRPAGEVDPAVIDAEARIRAFFAQEAPTSPFPYAVLQRLAMPRSVSTAPGPYESRAARGRWSLHPDGYYVRYFVERYDWTRVEIWVPQGSPAVGKEFDPAMHVAVPANLAAQAILLSGREQTDLSTPPEPGTSQPMPPPPGTSTGSRPPTSGGGTPPQPGTDPYVPPTPTPPQTPPAPVPPATSSGSPVVDGRFQPLRFVDARIDGGGPARDGMLHFVLTLKNPSTSPQTVNISGYTAILSDVDGLGVTSSTLYRPEGEPPATFDRSPTLMPGSELKVRFVVRPIEGGAPLQRLTLRESGSSPATFDVTPIVVAGRNEALPASVRGASPDFKPVGDFDVRFDGMQTGRDGHMVEAFVTFRNVTSAVQTIPIGGVRLMLADASGTGARDHGELWPARGIRGKALMQSVRVEPGAEARLRYAFREGPSLAATQLSVTFGRATQVFPLGAP